MRDCCELKLSAGQQEHSSPDNCIDSPFPLSVILAHTHFLFNVSKHQSSHALRSWYIRRGNGKQAEITT